MDFSGEWAPVYHEDAADRIPGPELGDYMGLPLNSAALLRAQSWEAGQISLMQNQCRPHSSDYGMRGLGNMRVTRDLDDAQEWVAFKTFIAAWGSERTIWMDGREHPPEYAEYTFQGFSSAVWEGNTLVVTTTHQKANYHRRNGVPSSDQRIITEYWTRHGDVLTVVTAVDDPVFFTEPLVRSQNWVLDLGQQQSSFYCEYVGELPELVDGKVPHYLPGENPYLDEIATTYGIPIEVLSGGAEKMYPEYQLVMPEAESSPLMCTVLCNCQGFADC
ncbi:MAG: hypothetical protein COA71_08985 [SAR86 cluster bacterium]|uniref:Uncharacterized protein n=1 Tax=SAR86 cluster bacterium TaxID=2030880 RepID=A0A2A5CCJ1_9GAMM|nr:MAG: hypothetical protein COA71_08985 [SAR86 cluster bacterium]